MTPSVHRSRRHMLPAKVRDSKLAMKAQKNAPTLLTIGGLVLIGGGAVLTWRAALKTKDILEEREEQLKKQEEVIAKHSDTYSEQEQQHDRDVINIQTGFAVAKTVLPPVAMFAAGAFMIGKGHSILSKRYAAATGALNTVTSLFDEYRQKVVDTEGKEKDLFYRYGITDEKVPVEEVDESGKKHKVKKDVYQKPEGGIGSEDATLDYAFFDESSSNWEKNSYYNLQFIDGTMKACQRFLDIHGWITMDRVLEKLGIWFPEGDPRNIIAHQIGWVKNGKRSGGHIDFGIFNVHEDAKRAFVNGYEPSVLLEFNHDGYILDKI